MKRSPVFLLSLFLFVLFFNGSICVSKESASERNAPDFYTLIWNEPSDDYYASVPLGNGELGVNAWVDKFGALHFFIARTDAWDEAGRQLKIGEVQIEYEATQKPQTPVVSNFNQTLDVKSGCLKVEYTLDGVKRAILLWVDSSRDIIAVELESEKEESVLVKTNIWRNERQNASFSQPGDLAYGKTASLLPDTFLSAEESGSQAIGWYHNNGDSTPEYDEVERIQGMDDAGRSNPLKNRIFGAIATSENAQRGAEGKTAFLRCANAKRHVVEIAVNTLQPSTPQQWIEQTQKILQAARTIPIQKRFTDTQNWWREFWNRSWIEVSQSKLCADLPGSNSLWTNCAQDFRLGLDGNGGSAFCGTFNEVKIIQKGKAGQGGGVLFEGKNVPPQAISQSGNWTFPYGGIIEANITLNDSHSGFRRVLDKIPVGSSTGFMVDITPQRKIRVISLARLSVCEAEVPKNVPVQIRADFDAAGALTVQCNGENVFEEKSWGNLSDEFIINQSYALQRYVNACGGRGNHAITYNGSIFIVPAKGRPFYADYRKWGSGNWWQNTRAVYHAMFACGDFDLQRPMFNQYRVALKWAQFRTKKYFSDRFSQENLKGAPAGSAPAYFAECIYAWGDVFPQSYGTTPWNERNGDPIQSSRWHKYEWVGGLELSFMALKYYHFTGDERFLKEIALPLADSTTRFFDVYYKTDPATGKLVMNPSQAVETWWDCTNPMPEIAGLRRVLSTLVNLDDSLVTPEQKAYWKSLLDKVPALPTWVDSNGLKRFAPAEKFAGKRNVENPEMYEVFPFRLVGFESPDRQIAVNALNNRWDKGPFCWRQDEIFMAYLGLANEAKSNLIKRAKNKGAQKFPAFWGPNYDWIPDQDHGGNLMTALQAMILQCDGDKIYLMPAWSKDWNVNFKLHAPKNTVISGVWQDGKMTNLTVEPKEREKDVITVSFPGGNPE